MFVGKRGTRLNHMPGGLMLRKLPTFLFRLEDVGHCMWLILCSPHLDSFFMQAKVTLYIQ